MLREGTDGVGLGLEWHLNGAGTAITGVEREAQDSGATMEILGCFDSFFLSVARYKLRIVGPPMLPLGKKPNPDKDGE